MEDKVYELKEVVVTSPALVSSNGFEKYRSLFLANKSLIVGLLMGIPLLIILLKSVKNGKK